jgi:hypothetical protein
VKARKKQKKPNRNQLKTKNQKNRGKHGEGWFLNRIACFHVECGALLIKV